MTGDWDPAQYLRFADHRTRPGLELIARIRHAGPTRIVDLGCGTGHLTAHLADRWPEATVVGVDADPHMLDEARADHPGIEWRQGDLATWDEPVDVVFSNAALHWVPNHERLVPRLWEALRPGGVLAFQVPMSWWEPSHRIARAILGGEGGQGPLGPAELRNRMAAPPVLQPEAYLRLLPTDATVDVWVTRYFQVLEGVDPVFEWVAGSLLRTVMKALSPNEWAEFESTYRVALREAYPRVDGRTIYPFPRLFVVASKPRANPTPQVDGAAT